MSEDGQPVLVVEDDDELRDVLLVLLELHGRRAIGAANGDEALALLREGLRPSLIVFDLMMPGKTGWEFRAEQLNNPAVADVPAVAISAAVQGESIQRALRTEAFLTKPLDIDRLLELVEQYCPGRGRRRL